MNNSITPAVAFQGIIFWTVISKVLWEFKIRRMCCHAHAVLFMIATDDLVFKSSTVHTA